MASSPVKFENPPIVELVLGVQFAPLRGLSSGHIGWFWKRYLGDEWTNAVDTFPIMDQFETFGNQPRAKVPDLSVLLNQGPLARRVQISTETGARMVQVQPTRFHYNWQKKAHAYPSYQDMSREFHLNFERFARFVAEAKLGPLEPNQWEITYVDHVPKGNLWENSSDWHKIFPGLLAPSSLIDGISFESVGGEWHFEIRPGKGRLHLGIQYGLVGEQSEPTLILNSTARGPINQETRLDLRAGLALGHEKLIEAFLKITSPEAHKAWKRVDQ
jgi:uncharacterized protein (TIGR04255 family)